MRKGPLLSDAPGHLTRMTRVVGGTLPAIKWAAGGISDKICLAAGCLCLPHRGFAERAARFAQARLARVSFSVMNSHIFRVLAQIILIATVFCWALLGVRNVGMLIEEYRKEQRTSGS